MRGTSARGVGRVPVIWVMAFLSALLATGYGVLFTMLDDFRDEYGIGETALGALIGLGFLSSFVGSILIAPQADRGHAKRLVFVGMALNLVGLLLMAGSRTFVALAIGRLIMGLGIGVAVPAIRRIVILAEPRKIGENLGRLVAADVAGFATGPAISAILVGPFGIPSPFLVVAATTAVTIPFVAAIRVDEAEEPATRRLALDLLANRPFAGAVMMGSAFFLMIGTFDALWAVVLDDLNTSEWIANLGITLFAIPLVVLATPGGRLAQRVGPYRVATAGLLLVAGYMTLYGVAPTGGMIFAIAMVHAVTDGFSIASTGVAVGMVIEPERQAGAQGVIGGLQTLTAGISAPIAGAVYQHVGRGAAYGMTAAIMVVMVVGGAWLARSAWNLTEETVSPDVARL